MQILYTDTIKLHKCYKNPETCHRKQNKTDGKKKRQNRKRKKAF